MVKFGLVLPLMNRVKILTIAVVLVAALVGLVAAVAGLKQQVGTQTGMGYTQTFEQSTAKPAEEAPAAAASATTRVYYQQQRVQPEAVRYRVVLISIDAARGMDVWELAKEGYLPNMARFVQYGVYGQLAPVFPAETSPNHAAMLTGAPVGVHGVISNTQYFKSPFEGGKSEPGYWGRGIVADTIWQAADRAGLRVVISNFIHGYVPTWQGRLQNAVIVYATKAYKPGLEFASASLVEGVKTERASGGLYQFTFTVGNTTFTGVVREEGGARYLYLYKGTVELGKVREGQWLPVDTEVEYRGTTYRVAFMLKPLSLDEKKVKVFIGNKLVYNAPVAWFMGPEEIKKKYWEEVVAKGYIDIYHVSWNVLAKTDLRTVAEVINATVDYYWRTNLFMFENVNFDLFTGYDVTPDPVEHLILGLFDPSMPYSNKTLAEWAVKTYLGMWQRIDSYVGRLMSKLEPNDVLIVVGDHGQWGIRAYVRINVALRKAGLLVVGPDGKVDLQKSAAYYDGGYIYINPRIREDPARYEYVVNKVIEAVTSIVDPTNGERPIAFAVARRSAGGKPLAAIDGNELSSMYLDGPGAAGRIGDVIIAVKPGYCAYDKTATGDDVVVIPSLFQTVGCHDDIGTWGELRSIIGIYGGRAVKLRQLKGIQAWMPQVGATVAAILNIQLKNATATPIWVIAS